MNTGYPLPPHLAFPARFDIPVASVISYAGELEFKTSPPSSIENFGWMNCDGRKLNVSDYPELFAAIGFIYLQAGEDSSENAEFFRIPDYRGYFLRAVNGNALDENGKPQDPDKDQRTLLNGNSSESVGSIENDALQSHQHVYTSPGQPAAPGGTDGTNVVTTINSSDLVGTPTDNASSPPGDVKVSDYESRPKNYYVYYLIKYAYLY